VDILRTFIEKDLGFVIVADPQKYSHAVCYKVYEVVGEHQDGSFVFHKEEGDIHPNVVQTIEDATPYLDGSVKWDGCSNWTVGYNDSRAYLMHFCSREQLENLGKVMARCWDLTRELCPNWQDL
jgi:hypothetical protein